MRAMRPLRQLPNASESGALEPVPSSFIFTKAGDSFSCRRIHSETPSRITDSRNGMRQLQSANAASPVAVRVTRMTSSERNRPSVAVSGSTTCRSRDGRLVRVRRRRFAAPPYSPPSAKPCSSRAMMRMTGAATPI